MNNSTFLQTLENKMDDYAHLVYKITRQFPKGELYGCTSQFRRASLSVVLNFIEGYARIKHAVKKNFWEISYGSLKESKYLIGFCFKENFMSQEECSEATKLAEEIGAMLWTAIESLKE